MPRIVAVHGIGQQFTGPNTLQQAWLPALQDGLTRVHCQLPNDEDLVCAFYGDLFRKTGGKALGEIPYDATDVTDDFERQLLRLWWQEAAQLDNVPGPEDKTKLRTPSIVQRALNALSTSRFFADVAERTMIGDLKQVRAYLNHDGIRAEVQRRVAQEIKNDTLVLIGHSLGSVVAYEALCANPKWPVRTLITLGSPLGVRNLIFDRLRPPPMNGVGAWPGGVQRWTNIADGGDIVALDKQLNSRFGEPVVDVLIYNGATAHDIRPYLTAEETGRAIAEGLSG